LSGWLIGNRLRYFCASQALASQKYGSQKFVQVAMPKRIAEVIYKRFRWIPIAWSWFWPVTQFALIFPAEMDDPNAPGPGTGNSWDTFGIANTGTVGLDLSTNNFTCQLGNNNLPGPADFHCGYLGQSFVVNPGEFTEIHSGLT
jgi:hypothetical protein